MMRNNEDSNQDAPPRLVAALRRVSRKDVFVPPVVDRSILRAARRHLEPQPPAWFHWPRLLLVSAAVVLVLGIAVWIVQPVKSSGSIVEDVNGDGRVDILDAFALARCLKTSPAACGKFDVNGDGILDQRDIDLLAAHAVRLDKQSGS
jgi:hypothetical protein